MNILNNLFFVQMPSFVCFSIILIVSIFKFLYFYLLFYSLATFILISILIDMFRNPVLVETSEKLRKNEEENLKN